MSTKFQEIIAWAQEQSSEGKSRDWLEKEYVTPNIEDKIFRRLEYGKNALLQRLFSIGKLVFPVKIGTENEDTLEVKCKIILSHKPKDMEIGSLNTVENMVDGLNLLESKVVRDEFIHEKYTASPSYPLFGWEKTCPVEVCLIDMGDISPEKKAPLGIIEDIYIFWNNSMNIGKSISIVLFVQGKIWEIVKTHTWLNKFEIFTLELSNMELIKIYKNRFINTEPFTEEALLGIAQLSNNNPRIFMKNILVAIDYVVDNKKDGFTVEDIEVVFCKLQSTDNIKLIIGTMFQSEQKIDNAMKVITYLTRHRDVPQKEIVDAIFKGNKSSASKVLSKLEKEGIVERGQKGITKIVNLK
jgi:hypothetical protein